MKTFYHLRKFLKENILYYIFGIFVLILVDGLQLIMPKILGRITDSLMENKLTINELYKYIAIILIVAVGISLCRFLWRMFITGSSRRMEYWLRNKLFAHLETLSLNFFNNHKTGDLMAHATNDLNAIRMAFGPGVVMMTDAIFLTILTVVMMTIDIGLKLTLVALIPLPIIAIVITFFGRELQKRFKTVQEAFSNLTNNVQEGISGIRIIKSFVQENNELKRFSEVNEENLDENMNLVKLFGLMFPVVIFISSISFVIALVYGGLLVINDELSLGQLVSFITYLGLLTWPMMAVGGVINMLQRGTASMKRINKILDTKPEIYDDEDTLDIKSIEGNIKFNNLNFSYNNTNVPALKNINLNIEKGKTLAVIGKTGSGKTTLINLLLRLYNTGSEELLIDGHDIKKIPLRVLRENIGYVTQENFLFSKTIKENIAFSNKKLSMDEVNRAAEVSQVIKEINQFPDKFDTELGERGVNLSGGQKQRISISRAVIKNPKILILDDSLSAVDTKTEESILEYLKEEMENRTSIIISHRISTIKDADEIIVLDEGEIIERGNHQELLEENGLYRELYEKQQLEEKIQSED